MAGALLAGFAVQPSGLLDEIHRIAPTREMTPRLSVAAAYRRCDPVATPGGSIPRTRCPRDAGNGRPEAFSRLRSRARRAHGAEGLHAIGVLELLGRRTEGNSPDRSILTLRTAARRPGASSGVWTDLSAAYLVRAQISQNSRDLLEAMVAAQQAIDADSTDRAAGFNLALALDWYGLEGEASSAWKRYLALDGTSGWAAEARERVRTLAGDAAPRPPRSADSAAEVATYVARWPQEARLHGWDRLLGEWGAAELRGDTGRAGDRLRLARALGQALARQGGDATLANATDAIRARSGDPAATRTLALAHVEYAAGQAAYADVDYRAARLHFARTLALRPPSAALEQWARLFHASMLIAAGQTDAAEPVLRTLVAQIDTVRAPALAGRCRWALGTTLLRGGRYEQALQRARDGARLLGRARELELSGAARYVAADASFQLGALPAAHEGVQRSLAVLRRHHGSVWLLNTLSVAAKTAEADGLPLAAIRIQGERVMRAERLSQPARVVEARLARARLLADAGMTEPARADVDSSAPLVETLPDGPGRTWLEADLRLARAAIVRPRNPARAVAILDSALALPAGSLTTPRLLRARVGRAEARLAGGDAPGAVKDLDAASLLLANARDSIAMTEFRASLLNAAKGVFDRLTLLSLAAGDTAQAFRYLERGRDSFGPRRGGGGAPEGRWRMRPGEVAAAYTLVGDTLLVWTVADARLRLARRTTSRTALLGAVEELRSSLERGSDDASVDVALAALYEQLVRPVDARLGVNTTLVLVADGELASVPFSALYDARRRRHLIETHPIRYAGSVRDAAHTREHAPPRDPSALLVADPAFDPEAEDGELRRLAGARVEVDSIAAAYSRNAVLSDAAATRSAFVAALPRAGVVHFAGHALFDDQRPERSSLVLAPERGGGGPARLTAEELEGMVLRSVDLVVLSACETLRSRNGRNDGFAGFAGALLDAGAGGVVGSLWRVDDGLTTPLMIEFHRAYRRSGDGPQALRDAQLRMLRSPHPARRAPAAWAGFRYAGN